MTDFGLLLKTLRSNANLTQQALAYQIGIKNGAISKWERGESFPNIFAIRKLSDILNVSCDELLHPTDTLAKMNTNTSDRNPDICEAITLNEAMEDNIPAKDASPAPLPIPFFLSTKKLFLICIPIFIFGIMLGSIVSHTVYSHRPAPSEQFTFVEANTAVDSAYGPAYELVYYIHDTELTNNEIARFANTLANDWDAGNYPDSTENVLIISFYAPDSGIYKPYDVYFSSTYLK